MLLLLTAPRPQQDPGSIMLHRFTWAGPSRRITRAALRLHQLTPAARRFMLPAAVSLDTDCSGLNELYPTVQLLPQVVCEADDCDRDLWDAIPLSEVQKHNTPESLWVTYQGSVYDVTDFINKHPGNQSSPTHATYTATRGRRC